MKTYISSNTSSPSPFSKGYFSNPPATCPSPAFHCPSPCENPKNPEIWNYGLNRVIKFWQSPPVGAGILAITVFLLITFSSNVLLERVTSGTLGIIVTLGTLGLVGLVILLLFIL